MKRIIVLGATGSLGGNFLDALRQTLNFDIIGLSCNENTKKLKALAIEFKVEAVASAKVGGSGPWHTFQSPGAQSDMIRALQPDMVVNAIAGIHGLEPSVTALQTQAELVMGCKEAIVAAGPLLKKIASSHKARIIPADSEHVAALELLKHAGDVKRLILTGTGGALRDLTAEQRENATPDQVMRHPIWAMGTKITVDSATLMNKALEVIEAAWLFDLPGEKIETRIHRPGRVHAALETTDNKIFVHEAGPSMRDVAYSILTGQTWGRIIEGDDARMILRDMPEVAPGSCAGLGHAALRMGGNAAAVLTGADQAVVEAFMQKKIKFGMISDILSDSMDAASNRAPNSINEVMSAYKNGYEHAWSLINAK